MSLPEPDVFARAFAEKIGQPPPSDEQFNAILDLAGSAAHSSARQAAPVCCWLAAKAGITAEEAREVAEALGSEFQDS